MAVMHQIYTILSNKCIKWTVEREQGKSLRRREDVIVLLCMACCGLLNKLELGGEELRRFIEIGAGAFEARRDTCMQDQFSRVTVEGVCWMLMMLWRR